MTIVDNFIMLVVAFCTFLAVFFGGFMLGLGINVTGTVTVKAKTRVKRDKYGRPIVFRRNKERDDFEDGYDSEGLGAEEF
jgi:hypothetical protein